MGTDDVRLFEGLALSMVVVGVDEAGVGWVGNQNCIVRNGVLKQPTPAGIAKLFDLGETVPLSWEYAKGGHTLLRESSGTDLRVFLSPEGDRVLLNDALCVMVEMSLGEDDEPVESLHWRQSAADPLGAVAASRIPGGAIDALIMPVLAR